MTGSKMTLLDRALLARSILVARCNQLEDSAEAFVVTLLNGVIDRRLTVQQALTVQRQVLNHLDRYQRHVSETMS